MSTGKTDVWMPVYIGDYLADTMHLTTEQHGAYLLLLFHLWRRGCLQDDDAVLGQISGLSPRAWAACRPMLAQFFKIDAGLWRHGRVERERSRIAAKQLALSSRSSLAARVRWNKAAPAADDEGGSGHSDASCMQEALHSDASSRPQALHSDAESESESESESKVKAKDMLAFASSGRAREKRAVDERHTFFRAILAEYWRAKNHAFPEMPWEGRDGKALNDFLAASPHVTSTQFRQMLGNRARSAVAHGDRVYLWIGNLTRFQEEITVYNKPASAGGSHASRAEINRNSVVSAVDRAMDLAREHADRTWQAGAEPAGFADAGVFAADGARPGGRSLDIPGDGDHGVAARDAAHGQAGADGSFSYSATATVTSRSFTAGRPAEERPRVRFEEEVSR